MQVGVGYTVRGYCDGQSLTSLGKWPVAARRYSETSTWREVVRLFRQLSQQYGTEELLINLSLGRVEAMPFPAQEVASVKGRIVEALRAQGFVLQDFRFIHLLLMSADVLVALMLYYGDEERDHRSSIRIVPTITDSRKRFCL